MDRAQINKLYDYTKFHIGLYTGVITALLALMAVGSKGDGVRPEAICYLKFAVGFIVAAGVSGGVIASTISTDQEKLLARPGTPKGEAIGPFGLPVMTAKGWSHAEHWAFWLGVFTVVVGFLRSY